MHLLSFTNLLGSLIHPLAMSIIVLSFFTTAILGLQVRRSRLHPSPEGVPLVPPATRKRYHHKFSALLLFSTVFFMTLGMGNTFLRTGRLFPGPHLYGAFVLLVLLSLNAAMVPWFKDIEKARLFHAIVGCTILAAVLWQAFSGIPILTGVVTKVPL